MIRRLFPLLFAALICLFGALPEPAWAVFGFAPQLYKSGYTYGSGVYFAPYQTRIYAEPRFDAEVLEEIQWQADSDSHMVLSTKRNTKLQANHVFLCYYPAYKVAMFAVMSENDQGWVEVMYDQANRKTGWVPLAEAEKAKNTSEQLPPLEETPAHFGTFQSWLEFMGYNAKAHGIYWLSGVKEYHRSVRTSDKDEASFLPVTVIRDIRVRHIRGNWMLVEVVDFERNTPIGWVRWRDNDGNLLVFPNLSKGYVPIVTTVK